MVAQASHYWCFIQCIRHQYGDDCTNPVYHHNPTTSGGCEKVSYLIIPNCGGGFTPGCLSQGTVKHICALVETTEWPTTTATTTFLTTFTITTTFQFNHYYPTTFIATTATDII